MRSIVLLLFCALAAAAQKKKPEKPAVPAPSPTGISIGLPFYSVDDAFRLKIRELEHRADQAEIEIQRLKVKIEQDKADEAEIWRQVSQTAAQYAKDHAIDPDRYDFDAGEVKFTQKKKP